MSAIELMPLPDWCFVDRHWSSRGNMKASLRKFQNCTITERGRIEMNATRLRWFYRPETIPEIFRLFPDLFGLEDIN